MYKAKQILILTHIYTGIYLTSAQVTSFGLAPGSVAEIGKKAELHCIFRTPDNDVLKFTKNGEPVQDCVLVDPIICYLPGSGYKSNYTFTYINSSAVAVHISPLQLNDSGRWECRIQGTDGVIYQLVVNVPVKYVKLTSPTEDPFTVQENETNSFYCLTSGSIPAPTVIWFKDSQTPDTTADDVQISDNITMLTAAESDGTTIVNSTLWFFPTKKDTGVRIYCLAKNVPWKDPVFSSFKPKLIVNYGPEKVTVVPSSTSYLQEENTELPKITCSAECNPVCNFEWTKQNSQVSNNEQLLLGSLEPSEAGTYRCNATRPGSTFFKHLELTVYVIYGPYKESTTLSPGETEYTINEKEILPDITCNADCYPYCNYTWTKLRDGSTSVESIAAVLSLGVLNRAAAAKYICSAVNLYKKVNVTTNKEVQIKVNYGPDTVCDNVSSVPTFTEGDNTASIRCFSDCYPGCSYTWSNGSGLLSSSDILSLGSVRRYQAGIYTFSARNIAQTYSRSAQKMFSIIIMYAPVVSVGISTKSHSKGTSLTMFCRGEGVPPNYIYTGLTQTVSGVQVPNANTALEGTETYSSIHFTSLQLEDTGNYTCRMNNGIRDLNGTLDQTGTVQLLVEVQPKILKEDLTYVGALNNPVTVQIPFYCYPAVQSVTFVRYDGTVIQSSTKYRISFMPGKVNDTFYGKEVTLNGYIAVLTINDLEEEDFVNYTLTAHNSRGTTSQLIFVVAESIPSVPKGFFLSSSKFLLIWEKGFNGGHLQTFIIQVSVDGKDEWHNFSRISEIETSFLVNSTFYSVEIKQLNPGTYSARLIAANSLGETVPLYLNSTFTILSLENATENPSQMVATAVGGSVSAVFVVIAVVVGVLVWRRRVVKNEMQHEPQTRQKETETKFCENSYYNIQSLQEGQSTYCDLMKTETVERSNYSDLHVYERHTEVSAYGNLKGADARDRNQTYAGLCPETREQSTNEGHDRTYVNLHLTK